MAAQPELEHPKKAFGWAARDPSGVLSPFNFSRRFTSFTYIYYYCQTILFLFKLFFFNLSTRYAKIRGGKYILSARNTTIITPFKHQTNKHKLQRLSKQ